MKREERNENRIEEMLLAAICRETEESLRHEVADGYDRWRRRDTLRRMALTAALFLGTMLTSYTATAAPAGQYMNTSADRADMMLLANEITQRMA